MIFCIAADGCVSDRVITWARQVCMSRKLDQQSLEDAAFEVNYLVKSRSPEEQELKNKRAQLKRLEARLAEKELDLATLSAELAAFENRYLHTVGILYFELDEILLKIAEANLKLHPAEVEVQRRAAEARARAEETAEAVGKARKREEQEAPEEFAPSEDLKKLYRDVAKKIHPDLSSDDDERQHRNELMSEANRAYKDGDTEKLRSILQEWETSPEAVKGEDVTSRLDRMNRKIEKIKARLEAIRHERVRLILSDIYKLKHKVEKATELGRDLLSEMASRVENDIAEARRNLEKLNRRLQENEQREK